MCWRTARLIPTTGIGGQDEQEQRATSSLLAVMKAVPQFGRALLSLAGAPTGRVSTFTEVRFPEENGKLSIPDGAVIVEWGRKRWVCLVEVKTGGGRTQARTGRLDISISLVTNGFDACPDDLQPDHRIARSRSPSRRLTPAQAQEGRRCRHFSWWQVIITEAIVQQHAIEGSRILIRPGSWAS